MPNEPQYLPAFELEVVDSPISIVPLSLELLEYPPFSEPVVLRLKLLNLEEGAIILVVFAI